MRLNKRYLSNMFRKNRGSLWITWERHRRTRSLAAEFGMDLYEIIYSGNAVLRYCYSILKTLVILIKERPDVLLVQSPSYILSFFAALLKPIFGYKLVIDAHNGVTHRLEARQSRLVGLIEYAVTRADLVIVTNDSVAHILAPYQSSVIELPDMIPVIRSQSLPASLSNKARPYITLIASFQYDEPIDYILEACKTVLEETSGHVFVTGKVPAAFNGKTFKGHPNITFTGYLSHDHFDGLIQHSDLLIDISTEEPILVCGGYEAIAVGVPAIVSDSPISRKISSRGFIYAGCSIPGYTDAIATFLDNPAFYKGEMLAFKKEFSDSWRGVFTAVEKKLLALNIKGKGI